MAPIKVTFKTVQGNKFELDLESSEKVMKSNIRILLSLRPRLYIIVRSCILHTHCMLPAV